jgi:hypothetical protein
MELLDTLPRTPSSFGIGDQTVFDETVRRAWEVTPVEDDPLHCQVMRGVEEWASNNLDDVFVPPGARVRVDVHKVCVYETGGFFKRHSDTIREPNHFATLVRVLDCSAFEGGQLVVNDVPMHRDHLVVFRCHVPHEVTPVTSGRRISITYNIVLETSDTVKLNAHDMTMNRRTANNVRYDQTLLGHVIDALRPVVCEEGRVALGLLQFAPLDANMLFCEVDTILRDATQGHVRAFVVSQTEDEDMTVAWFQQEYLKCNLYFGVPSELKAWYHQRHCDYMGNEAQASHLICFGHALLVTAADLGV